jgi:hypothetical protein
MRRPFAPGSLRFRRLLVQGGSVPPEVESESGMDVSAKNFGRLLEILGRA